MNGYSYSSISNFNNCPKSFEYRYIKNIPEIFTSIEAFMGSTVHSVLELIYRNKDIGINTEESDLSEIFRKIWDATFSKKIKIIKTENDLQYYIDSGINILTNYYLNIFLSDRSKTISLEEKFEITLDGERKFRGIIDRLSRTEEGILRITDFKTGTATDPLENLQLPSYAVHIFQTNGEEEIELCIEDLKQRKRRVARVKKDIVKKTENELISMIEIIENTKEFKTKISQLCQWCGYNELCPEYNKIRNTGNGETNYCPDCGSELAKRKGKFGEFLGCTGFPECKYTFNLGNPTKETDGKMICPECGGDLRKRRGKFGEFFGCSSYPQCTFTRKLE